MAKHQKKKTKKKKRGGEFGGSEKFQIIIRNLWKISLAITFYWFLLYPLHPKVLLLPFHADLPLQTSSNPLLTAPSTTPLCTFSSSHRAGRRSHRKDPSNLLISLLQSSPLTFSSATVPARNNKIHKKLHFLAWGNNFANIYEQYWLQCVCSDSKGHRQCQKLIICLILGAFRMRSAAQGIQGAGPCDPSSLLGCFGPFSERHGACSQLSWHSVSLRQGFVCGEAQAK